MDFINANGGREALVVERSPPNFCPQYLAVLVENTRRRRTKLTTNTNRIFPNLAMRSLNLGIASPPGPNSLFSDEIFKNHFKKLVFQQQNYRFFFQYGYQIKGFYKLYLSICNLFFNLIVLKLQQSILLAKVLSIEKNTRAAKVGGTVNWYSVANSKIFRMLDEWKIMLDCAGNPKKLYQISYAGYTVMDKSKWTAEKK